MKLIHLSQSVCRISHNVWPLVLMSAVAATDCSGRSSGSTASSSSTTGGAHSSSSGGSHGSGSTSSGGSSSGTLSSGGGSSAGATSSSGGNNGACGNNTDITTALTLNLGESTAGIACYNAGGTFYYWKATGTFVVGDSFRLRVTFDNGANAGDVDFILMYRNGAGDMVSIADFGNCSNAPGVDEDCGGTLTEATGAIYVNAHPLATATAEPFHMLLEKVTDF